jgi:hypothetical protein
MVKVVGLQVVGPPRSIALVAQGPAVPPLDPQGTRIAPQGMTLHQDPWARTGLATREGEG